LRSLLDLHTEQLAYFLKVSDRYYELYGIFQLGFEFFTAVVVKISIYWYITPCSPWKANRRFGGTCRLHLLSRRISQARNESESRRLCFLSASSLVYCLAYSSTLKMEAICSSETSVDLYGLQGVISQKTEH
jgi:hypothetical protein